MSGPVKGLITLFVLALVIGAVLLIMWSNGADAAAKAKADAAAKAKADAAAKAKADAAAKAKADAAAKCDRSDCNNRGQATGTRPNCKCKCDAVNNPPHHGYPTAAGDKCEQDLSHKHTSKLQENNWNYRLYEAGGGGTVGTQSSKHQNSGGHFYHFLRDKDKSYNFYMARDTPDDNRWCYKTSGHPQRINCRGTMAQRQKFSTTHNYFGKIGLTKQTFSVAGGGRLCAEGGNLTPSDGTGGNCKWTAYG